MHQLHSTAFNCIAAHSGWATPRFVAYAQGLSSPLPLNVDLTNYMDRRSSNSGGSSAGSAVAGSTSAPSSYGIQFIPQPQVMPSQMPSMSLGTPAACQELCLWRAAVPQQAGHVDTTSYGSMFHMFHMHHAMLQCKKTLHMSALVKPVCLEQSAGFSVAWANHVSLLQCWSCRH